MRDGITMHIVPAQTWEKSAASVPIFWTFLQLKMNVFFEIEIHFPTPNRAKFLLELLSQALFFRSTILVTRSLSRESVDSTGYHRATQTQRKHTYASAHK